MEATANEAAAATEATANEAVTTEAAEGLPLNTFLGFNDGKRQSPHLQS